MQSDYLLILKKKMKIILSAAILFLLLNNSKGYSQLTDTISFQKGSLTSFSYKNKYLPPRHLFLLLARDAATEPYLSMAKSNHRASGIFGFAGGFLAGWQIGRYKAGNEPNTAAILIGSGLIALAIPLHFNYVSYAKKAAAIYNANRTSPESATTNLTISTYISHYGLSVKIQF